MKKRIGSRIRRRYCCAAAAVGVFVTATAPDVTFCWTTTGLLEKVSVLPPSLLVCRHDQQQHLQQQQPSSFIATRKLHRYSRLALSLSAFKTRESGSCFCRHLTQRNAAAATAASNDGGDDDNHNYSAVNTNATAAEAEAATTNEEMEPSETATKPFSTAFITIEDIQDFVGDDGGYVMDGHLMDNKGDDNDNDDMFNLDDLFLEEEEDSSSTFDDEEEDSSVVLTDKTSGRSLLLSPLHPSEPATQPSPIPLDVISPNLSYFYLRDELGLSEDIMWKITMNAPSVLGSKAEFAREKVRVLKLLMGLSDDEIRHIVSVQPTILQLSAKKNIAPTVLYLQRQLDLSRKELRQLLLGNPSLLNYSLKNLHSKVVLFFQQTMGYTPAEVRKILLQDPWLFACSVHNGLLPRLEFLHKEVKISSQDLRAIILKHPKILRMSVDQNLQPKLIFFFILTLRMSTQDISKLLLKYPRILDFNLERHIQPIYQYLLQLELLSSYEFANILKRCPRFISFSLARIKQRIGYLRYQLCLDAKSIRRILYQSPQIMSLSQENLESSVQFLLEAVAPNTTLQYYDQDNTDKEEDLELAFDKRYLEEDDDATGESVVWNVDNERYSLNIVQTMVSGMPSLLHMNTTTSLQPKVDYLRNALGQDTLSRALLTFPPLLGYSLQNRIQPRLEKLLEAGVDGSKISYCLPMTQEKFETWLERQKKEARAKKKKLQIGAEEQASSAIAAARKAYEEAVAAANALTVVGNREIKDGGRITHWRRKTDRE